MLADQRPSVFVRVSRGIGRSLSLLGSRHCAFPYDFNGNCHHHIHMPNIPYRTSTITVSALLRRFFPRHLHSVTP